MKVRVRDGGRLTLRAPRLDETRYMVADTCGGEARWSRRRRQQRRRRWAEETADAERQVGDDESRLELEMCAYRCSISSAGPV